MKTAYVMAFIDEDNRIFLNDQIITQTRFFSLKQSAKLASSLEALSHFSPKELTLSLRSAQNIEAQGLRKIALLVQISKKHWLFNRIEQGYYKAYTFLDARPPRPLENLTNKEAYLEKLYLHYEEQGYHTIIVEKGENLKILNTPYYITPQSHLDKNHAFKVKEVENLKSTQHILVLASEVEVFEKEHLDRPAHVTYACPELRSLIIYYSE